MAGCLVAVALLACFAIVTACGGGDSEAEPVASTAAGDGVTATTTDGDAATATTEGEAAATATTEAEPTSTPTSEPTRTSAEPGPDLPDSPLRAPLRGVFSYGSNENLAQSDAPQGLQNVFARWYRGGGRLIVVYEGLDLDVTGPVCPGAAAFVNNRFEFRTVSPTTVGACDGEPNQQTIASADAGVRICDGVVSYITLIPEDTEGDLYSEVNALPEGEDWFVVHIQVPRNQELPEIDPAILEC